MNTLPEQAILSLMHLLAVVTLGGVVAVLLAYVAERFLLRAGTRRLLWQSVLLAIAGLVALELSGAGQGASMLLARFGARETRTRTAAESSHVVLDLSRTFPLPEEPLPKEAFPVPAYEHAPVLLPEGATLFGPEEVDAATQGEYSSGSFSEIPILAMEAGVESESPFPSEGTASTSIQTLAAAVVLAFWVGGIVFFSACMLLARWRLHGLRRHWRPSDSAELNRLVEELRAQLGMRRSIRICTAPDLVAPVAFGTFRPTVLLPSDFPGRFSLIQQRAILAHEVAHLAGGDPAWMLVGGFVGSFLWWHPLVHVACRRLAAVSEQAADEASVLVPDGPEVLAECLVQLGRRLVKKPRLGWVAAQGSGLRSGLAQRVQQLMKLEDGSPRLSVRPASRMVRPVAVLLLMVVTISCTLWVRPKVSFAKGDETMNVLRLSWRQSLAAAALTAFLGPLGGEAPADDGSALPPKPPQLAEGSPADQILLADRGEREREEREMRGDHREQPPRAPGARPRPERERDERAERAREGLRREAEEVAREKAKVARESQRVERELTEAIEKTKREREEIVKHLEELEGKLVAIKKEHPDNEGGERAEQFAREMEEARHARAERAEQLENLERELAEHRENMGRRNAELERAMGELREQRNRMRAEPERDNPEGREIFQRISQIGREVAELARAGKHEDVERLQREMRELRVRLAEVSGRERPGRPEGAERIEVLERELVELRESGRHDGAERVERELQELHRRLGAGREKERPEVLPELQVQLDHLQVAMENLHAAGLHEPAEDIARQIDQIRREHGIGEPRPEGEVVDQLRAEIQELRRQNWELKRGLNELRAAHEAIMKELRGRPTPERDKPRPER